MRTAGQQRGGGAREEGSPRPRLPVPDSRGPRGPQILPIWQEGREAEISCGGKQAPAHPGPLDPASVPVGPPLLF